MPNKNIYGFFLLFGQTQVLPHQFLGMAAINTLNLEYEIKLSTLAIEVGLSQHWILCQQWTQQEKTVWNACNWVHKSTSSCPHAEHLLLCLKIQGVKHLYCGSTQISKATGKKRNIMGKIKTNIRKMLQNHIYPIITKPFVQPFVKAMKVKTEKNPNEIKERILKHNLDYSFW